MTTKFDVRMYPKAAWNDETEEWDLGAPGDLIQSVDAEYPAAAQAAVLGSLRLDLRGTTFLSTSQAVAAWESRNGVVAIVAADEVA